jgi:hypothetical protein
MEDGEFKHPGLRMISTVDGLHIILPVKAERYRQLLYLVWFLVWMGGEAALVAGFIGWKSLPVPPEPFPIVFLAAFTAAGAFVFYRLLWYSVGREVFNITRDMVTARRQIWRVGHARTFYRERIQDVRARPLEYQIVYPSWGRMFIGHGDGEILIESDGKTFAYGKGLEMNEARALAGLIRRESHLQPRERRPSDVRSG